MYNTIGPSALAGVVVILILLPINGVFLANQVRKLQVSVLLLNKYSIKLNLC